MPDENTATMVATGESFTVRLVGWCEFNDSVRALLFGHMVKLAKPIVQEYQSDLYHDAMWLAENVTGARTFEWLVRPSGTNIDGSAEMGVKIGTSHNSRFYIVKVFNGRERIGSDPNEGDWHATFTRVPLMDVLARK